MHRLGAHGRRAPVEAWLFVLSVAPPLGLGVSIKLTNNNITEEGCHALTSVLCSNPSNLIELDLSFNNLGNSGVQHICSMLKKTNCKLQKLELNNCSITDVGCDAVASALHSNFSLKELDLDKNKIGQSGVQKLSDLLKNSNCALEKLNVFAHILVLL
uniref:Uncharacterized protein n=1 Tax=Astyanax mexicanus TaxID=7994 RepID=A0A8B9H7T0_ASTMX